MAFLGEVRTMSFNFAPKGWALCNGQLLPITQNQALFSLFGTRYGGDGKNNFALPDLRGRVPIDWVQGVGLGQAGGEAVHTLSLSEMAGHSHLFKASQASASTSQPAAGEGLAASTGASLYAAPANLVPMSPTAVSVAGGSQPHDNMQPYLTISCCVALQGMYPSAQ